MIMTSVAGKLTGSVALVTGASRGIGRGIALQLGEAGAIVYVTGRSKDALESTCQEITNRGGEGKAIIMDHGNDQQVEELFERIGKEQNGKLDLLVNNAYAGVHTIMKSTGKPFWETEATGTWDSINGVGLRGHYLCTVHASRLMVPRKSGLIVNVSSAGGLIYLFNCAYGIGKSACDRMAADCGHELRKHNVAMISLWPGPVKTENITDLILNNEKAPAKSKQAFEDGETVEFAGKAVAHLAADPNKIKKTGRIIPTSDLAYEYGFVDEDGKIHGDLRSVKGNLIRAGWHTTAALVPSFVRIPSTIIYYLGYKF